MQKSILNNGDTTCRTSSSFIQSPKSDGNTTLQIISLNGGLSLHTAVLNIKNESSNVTAQNVTIQMQIHGGFLGLLNYTITLRQQELQAGDTIELDSGVLFGLYPIHIIVNAYAINAPLVQKKRDGYLFGFFVFLENQTGY